MAKEIVLSWTKVGYTFTVDGVDVALSVRSAAMKMAPGRRPAIVIELDADLVRMEPGFQGAKVCNEGSLCDLPVGHAGEHVFEPVHWAEEQEAAEL